VRHCIGQQFFGYPQAAAFNLLAWWGMAVDDNDMFIFRSRNTVSNKLIPLISNCVGVISHPRTFTTFWFWARFRKYLQVVSRTTRPPPVTSK